MTRDGTQNVEIVKKLKIRKVSKSVLIVAASTQDRHLQEKTKLDASTFSIMTSNITTLCTMAFSIISFTATLSIKRHYPECECHCGKCHYSKRHYVESCCAKCHYAECRGAPKL